MFSLVFSHRFVEIRLRGRQVQQRLSKAVVRFRKAGLNFQDVA